MCWMRRTVTASTSCSPCGDAARPLRLSSSLNSLAALIGHFSTLLLPLFFHNLNTMAGKSPTKAAAKGKAAKPAAKEKKEKKVKVSFLAPRGERVGPGVCGSAGDYFEQLLGRPPGLAAARTRPSWGALDGGGARSPARQPPPLAVRTFPSGRRCQPRLCLPRCLITAGLLSEAAPAAVRAGAGCTGAPPTATALAARRRPCSNL